MIKVENIHVDGFEAAIKGMRNPLNSWDKSDSTFSLTERKIGPNDLDLMKRLYSAGSEHRKYLRFIHVSMDITAPVYWDAEFDTYKIGVTRNSCSFMHKGVSKPFDIFDFSVADENVYECLSPLEKKKHELVYPYETEEFKIYEGSGGRKYEVYRNGRVVALPFEYTDTYGSGRHREFKRREVKPSITNTGYYQLNLCGRYRERWMLHKLVAHVWIDNPDCLRTVNHIDGNKGNNSVENLEWCSLEDNIRKGFDGGLFENGKSFHARYLKWKNGFKSILDPLSKIEVRHAYEFDKMRPKEIAEKFDLTKHQVYNVIHMPPCEDNETFELAYFWETTIDELNRVRDLYLETKDENCFIQLRCMLPMGYNYRFTVDMNYENVFNMIHQRENHRLPEWNDFIDILKTLPYVREIGGF